MQARATRRLLLLATGLAAFVFAGRPAGAKEAGWAALARPEAVAVMRLACDHLLRSAVPDEADDPRAPPRSSAFPRATNPGELRAAR